MLLLLHSVWRAYYGVQMYYNPENVWLCTGECGLALLAVTKGHVYIQYYKQMMLNVTEGLGTYTCTLFPSLSVTCSTISISRVQMYLYYTFSLSCLMKVCGPTTNLVTLLFWSRTCM